eukprot:scaffold145036_cov19-Prasinocladus_malaysianus.AAC.1
MAAPSWRHSHFGSVRYWYGTVRYVQSLLEAPHQQHFATVLVFVLVGVWRTVLVRNSGYEYSYEASNRAQQLRPYGYEYD